MRMEDLPVLTPTKNKSFRASLGNIPFHSSENFTLK